MEFLESNLATQWVQNLVDYSGLSFFSDWLIQLMAGAQ